MSDFSFNTVSSDVFGMFTRSATFDDVGEYFDKPVPIRRQNAFSDYDLLSSKRRVIRKNALGNKRIISDIKKINR
tara:strand:- start:116 stop:340 length:225 start_codon:yes stop_codon:yes gene_type:complete